MHSNQTHLDNLIRWQDANSGWGYQPNSAAQVEPTCLAMLALASATSEHQEAVANGVRALLSWQEPDGCWRVRQGRPEAVWPTALALFTLAALDADSEAQRRAATWLLGFQGQTLKDPEAYQRDFDVDPALQGWSWTEGTFSWTEPTSWACMALRSCGYAAQPRVQMGLAMLHDRTFDHGGVNSGNRLVFGRPTEPVPTMSALMLLAHVGLQDQPRLRATRQYLRDVAEQSDDLEHLCWIRLALASWGETAFATSLDQKIGQAYAARCDTALFPDSVVREALTAMALTPPEQSPFRKLSAADSRSDAGVVQRRGPSVTFMERVQGRLRGLGVLALNQMRAPAATAAVHVAAASGYDDDLASVLVAQFAHFREKVPLRGKRVLLKPNLVEYHRDRVINTHPAFIAAAIELCQREGAAEVLVAEGPGHWRNVEYLVTASGLGDVLRTYKVPFIDLNHEDPVKTPNLSQLTKLEYLYLAHAITTADVVISLPKMKTHHWAGVTLSLKNLFGTMPGICYGWPKNELHWRGIDNSIVDIALTRPPDLAIVDGIVAMEGDGPLNGTPVPLQTIVMGTDLVAVDATCCRLMQLDPGKVGHLQLAARRKLGRLDEMGIQQLGETILSRSRRFEVLPRFDQLRMGAEAARSIA